MLTLSPDELRRLLLLCHDDDELPEGEAGIASYQQLSMRELLRGQILDSYVNSNRLRNVVRHSTLTTFILRGSARAAARICELPNQRAADWAAEFLEFAADWLATREDERVHRDRMRSEDWQRRLLQCQHICGRKSFKGGSSLLEDWTGCQACPLNQLA